MKARIEQLAFVLTCLYLMSQVFLVPVATIGPSWAIWPTITDIVVAMMGGLLLFNRSWNPGVPKPIRSLWIFGVLVVAGCFISYFFLTLYALKYETGFQHNGKSVAFGIAQLYRLLQVLVVLRAVVSFDLTHSRLRLLKRLSVLAFCLVCGGVFATYTGLVSTQTLAFRIPPDFGFAGPWAYYSTGTVEQGVGTISYNHGYTAMQILLCGALCLVLNARAGRTPVLTAIVPLAAVATCFISGSRAGFLTAIFFAICVSRLGLQSMLVWLSGMALVLSVSLVGIDTLSVVQKAIARQTSSADSYEEDGLSGRTQIWSEELAFMNSESRHWLVGAGFGSTVETGTNAHNLLLQLLVEGGALAVALFIYLQFQIISLLVGSGQSTRPLLWATIALLLTSFTQETFYPVPAFPHFLAFFFSALALSTMSPACPSIVHLRSCTNRRV
jgi:O-antigen ligase